MQEVRIPMILMDSDGFILGLNRAACECLKYELGDVAQKTIVSITDESDQQREVKNSIDLFYGRKLSSIHQKKFVTKGGRQVPVFQYISMIKNETNKQDFAVVHFHPCQENMLNNEILLEKLRQIAGFTRLFDFDEFGSRYNSRIVSEIQNLAKDLTRLMRN